MRKARRSVVALVIASMLAVITHTAPNAVETVGEYSAAMVAVGGTLLLGGGAAQIAAPNHYSPTFGFWSWVRVIASAVALFVMIWCHDDVNEGDNWGC